MKKTLCFIVALMLVCMMSLVGCGGDSAETEVQTAADNFLSALQEGDLDKLKETSSEDLLDSGALKAFNEIDSFEDTMVKALGLESGDLGDEAKASLKKFTDDFIDKLVDSYEIGDVTVDDEGVGTVNATITYGIDVEKLTNIDTSNITSVNDLATKYMNEHKQELLEIYQKDGEKAMMVKVANDLLPDLMDAVSEEMYKQAEGSTIEEVKLTVKKNDDGAYVVTDMQSLSQKSGSEE